MDKLSGVGAAKMSEYRAYLIGKDGHIVSFRSFICDSDSDATVWAKQLMGGSDIELWSGDRLVTRLNAAAPRSRAVSHEVRDGRLVPKE